ncbi:polyprenyl synthetase family protein [Nonomuraea indica]|uniref:Polyprenyl synthetase family protein n=1 Tax=Nonomuraea indica TaxID=1581193 RepID=A0ABW8AHV3_9ACTN
MTTTASRTDTVRDLIDDRLGRFLDQRGGELDFLGPDAAPVRDLMNAQIRGGGKRLRPLFVYWGHRLSADGRDEDGEAVLAAACAVELVHTAALILDDIMDEAPVRRGRPSAHHALAARHERAGWRGDPTRFGESAAVLLGLLAFTWADAALLGTGPRLGPALEVFTRLRLEAIGGQYLDLACAARGTADVRQAAHLSLYKTGKYTVERPLHLGHAVAGGGPGVRRLLSAYAAPLGEAFQLRDDVLGVFGDPARTGKPGGLDLLQGKATSLVARTRLLAGPRAAALLDHVRDAEGVAAARELVVSCGALDAVERRIAELADRSAAVLLDDPGLPPDAVDALVELCGSITRRTS